MKISACFTGTILSFSFVLTSCRSEDEGSVSKSRSQWSAEKWEQIVEGVEGRSFAKRSVGNRTRYTKIEGAQIGMEFQNLLLRKNIKNYLLTGAGLTVGDVDGNGLPDVFLVSQDGPNKLFKQVAPWKFEDATVSSGLIETKLWGAGAAFVDLDNDGDLDLYVCNKGALDEVYLNNGNGSFAGRFFGGGKVEHRAPTMVAVSDYDRDGDLDFYRTETRMWGLHEMFGDQVKMMRDENGVWQAHPSAGGEYVVVDGIPREMGTQDHLFRNDATAENPMAFRDVTMESGISGEMEHGLAAVWWDFDNDLNPDLYISNDFHTPDHLYRNTGKGTFEEITEGALPYTSWSSMGSDFADINNDGWLDYLSTDMSATTHFKQKTMMGAMVDTKWFLDHLEPRQYMRNAMQVNTGTGKFLDIAFYAGIDSTDWTWSGIFGDLDNDGLEDVFFTNGIERNVQDSDAAIRHQEAKQNGATEEELQQIFLDGPRFKERNMAFKNTGDLKFDDIGNAWGLDDETVSHGAVLVDLDRDGDLDLIVNNMNDPVGIYRNDSTDRTAVLVSLRGRASNYFGLGTRVEVKLEDGVVLNRIMTSSRGYMSGVEPVLHFGLGDHEVISELKMTWPSGVVQRFEKLEAGYHYRVSEGGTEQFEKEEPEAGLFAEVKGRMRIEAPHRENVYDDFSSQPLLPNKLSQFGPAMALGDVNGDGRPDFYFGGSAGDEGTLQLQGDGEKYVEARQQVFAKDASQEDVAAAWFDADGDGDLDLYVVSGGANKKEGDAHYQDRLYLNEGGVLAKAELPEHRASGSCVAVGDFDGDGDQDLFVGARHIPGRYPTVPESQLLQNEGGKFLKLESPVTSAGLVTGAQFGDLDGDGRLDLVIATEWGPVKVFKNTPAGFVEETVEAGISEMSGWWTCVELLDLENDGDLDIVAGNYGLNTKYHVDAEHPATLFAHDFGGQGKLQLVEAKSKDGELLPVRGRSCSTTAMPHLLKNAPSYNAFASKTLADLYTPKALDEAIRLEANTLATMIFRNDGKGSFAAKALPTLSQLSPVMGIASGDFDGDGTLDLALGQNFYGPQRETGRMNAGLGVILIGSLDGTFRELWPMESGFVQREDLRGLEAVDLNGDGRVDLISANNSAEPRVFLNKE